MQVPSFYVFDELVVTQISRLSLPQLLNTIKVEPHPPLFYIFLKLLPTENVLLSKLLVTFLSYFSFLVAFLYAFRKKLIQHYKLSLGLTIFVISFGFLEITSTIKQDSVSLPILLLVAFISLYVTQRSSLPKVKELLIAHFLTVILLFTGYLSYFQAMLILLLVTIYLYKFRLPKYLYAAQVLVLLVYFSFYGYSQFLANTQRFNWANDLYNSLIFAIRTYASGYSSINYFSEALLFAFFFFFIKSLIKPPPIVKWLFSSVIFLIIFLALTSYLTKFFIAIRYISFLYLLMSLVVGWGISSLKFKKGYVYLFLTLIFIVNIAYYTVHSVSSMRANWVIETILNRYSKTEKVGFLMDHPISPLIHVLNNNSNQNTIPVSALFPQLLEARKIDAKVLTTDGYFEDKRVSDIKKLLSENNLENYIYLLTLSNKQGYYDPERLVLRTLDDSCKNKEFYSLNYNNIIFAFRGCEL